MPHLPRLAGGWQGWSVSCPWREQVGGGGGRRRLGGPLEAERTLYSVPFRLSLTSCLTPLQLFTDAQQLQPLQVYQAPLSLATVPHQALGRTQSSPAAPGSMKSPPDQPTKHLFTTGKPYHCPLHPSTMHQGLGYVASSVLHTHCMERKGVFISSCAPQLFVGAAAASLQGG